MNDYREIFEKYSSYLTSGNFPEIQDVSFDELEYITKNLEDFLLCQSNDVNNESSVIVRLAEIIVRFGLVKTSDTVEDRDYDSRDFPYVASNAVECFKLLHFLLNHYGNIDTPSKRKFLVQVVLLCATHNSKTFWSNDESFASSEEFLKQLLSSSKHDKLSSLLIDDTFHPTIFKAVLKFMRPNLMKNTWLKNPSYCYIFHWLLSHVKHPHLIEYFDDVLPPPFMFLNYHAVPQQVLGIKCIDHILDNVPPSLIISSGSEFAIYDTLKRYIYSKEVPIVEVLYPCLLKLPMMRNFHKVDSSEWLQFDVILQEILRTVDMESEPSLRHLFLTQAYLFIKCTPCFKHLKKALFVLLHNFTANSAGEEKCRVSSLKILNELIRSCWPRMEYHCEEIMMAIIKAIYDIEKPSYELDNILAEEVLELCKSCLKLLKHACPEKFMNLVNDYIQTAAEELLPGLDILQNI